MIFRISVAILTALGLVACSRELPPRSVQEFVDNTILLEAAIVRCSRDRIETRYAAECVNAREAVKILSAREEAARRAEMETLSEQKRRSLRRVQDATAEARRRAEEQKRLKEEAEYLAQFGVLPDGSLPEDTGPSVGNNVPGAILPAADPEDDDSSTSNDHPSTSPAATGANAPGVFEPEEEDATDIQSIRDELKRRQESDDSP